MYFVGAHCLRGAAKGLNLDQSTSLKKDQFFVAPTIHHYLLPLTSHSSCYFELLTTGRLTKTIATRSKRTVWEATKKNPPFFHYKSEIMGGGVKQNFL